MGIHISIYIFLRGNSPPNVALTRAFLESELVFVNVDSWDSLCVICFCYLLLWLCVLFWACVNVSFFVKLMASSKVCPKFCVVNLEINSFDPLRIQGAQNTVNTWVCNEIVADS